MTWILATLAVAAVAVALAQLTRRRGRRRQQAMTQLLDAADALEDRLRTARSEIEAIAGTDQNPVREAMQEMLRHRLWLQQHGAEAPLEQLDSVRDAIEDAQRSIDRQLVQIERARAPQH
ncbi:hypothetical protein E2F46_05450 [Luteimonas aestuarii]|uniref:Uncharacterized protein n=1 Tax=Luteimonas aestuarii TaxID=453837 RepID=A0A4R5TXX5_9GAMM|nr:hypothetical protein [Luteimonas aestuarii]TDK26048.1 hypothetical protein E2F46_05450 [Luteimonas aestuarii]